MQFRDKDDHVYKEPSKRQLYGLSIGAKDNYQALSVVELSFDKEKVPQVS